ncbi:MAG: hypothetical protein AB1847_20675 [bacterium]
MEKEEAESRKTGRGQGKKEEKAGDQETGRRGAEIRRFRDEIRILE